MDALVPYPAFDAAALTDLTAAGGALDGAKVRLYQNDQVPLRNSPDTDFDIATYTGYADEAVTWNAVSTADDGTPEVVGLVGEFRPTGTTITNQIYGANLISSANVFFAGARFSPAPVPMETTSDAIQLMVRVRATPTGFFVTIS